MSENSKFIRVNDSERWNPPGQPHSLEVDSDEYLRANYRVITGIGVRMNPGNVTLPIDGLTKIADGSEMFGSSREGGNPLTI